jgi:PQQ enzyme repeat
MTLPAARRAVARPSPGLPGRLFAGPGGYNLGRCSGNRRRRNLRWNADRRFLVVDAKSGNILWQIRTPYGIIGQPFSY